MKLIGYGNCNALEVIEYKLPPIGVTAGRALQHSKSVVEALFRKHSPMIFKFGYTHNPEFRWSAPRYGYCHDQFDKWSNMVVLFQSPESSGPAMLEACLIDAYRSILVMLIPYIKAIAFAFFYMVPTQDFRYKWPMSLPMSVWPCIFVFLPPSGTQVSRAAAM